MIPGRRHPPALPGLLLASLLAGGPPASLPHPLAAQEPAADAEKETPEAEEEILGAPSGFELRPEALPSAEVEAGSRLRQSPDLRSPAVATVDVTSELEVLERRPGWLRVRYGPWTGWVLDPRGGAPAAAAGCPSRDEERLAGARRLLGEGARESTLGGFRLHTDLRRPGLLQPLAAVIGALPATYEVRYGLEVPPCPEEAVVLFEREQDYRAHERDRTELSPLGASGHAGEGVATLFAGSRSADALLGLLVHELTHLLNHRVFPAPLPPWLEEGLAEDLGFSRVEEGRLVPGTLRGERSVERRVERTPDGREQVLTQFRLSGARAALGRLLESRRSGDRVPLTTLADLTWSQIVDPENRELLYTQSAFLVRFLLDASGEVTAERFRAFLGILARGGPDDARALEGALGTSLRALEPDFQRFLEAQGQAAGTDYVPGEGEKLVEG